MKPYICPKCGATQDPDQMPTWNPWVTVYTFRCKSCATMLRLHGSRWSPAIALTLLPLFMVGVEVLLSSELARSAPYMVPYLRWRRITIWVVAGFMAILHLYWLRQGPKLTIYSDE